MSNIVYRRAEPDDAEAVYVFGRQLLSETSLMLLYPDERAKSVDDMRFVIQRFPGNAKTLLDQRLGRRALRR